jgi:endonuclease/exonuclease/phosphatase family metal-dependent hydrolase
MKTYKQFFCLLLLAFSLFSFAQAKDAELKELKVLQLNVWKNGTNVPGAPQGLVDLIDQTDPDVVLLCELKVGSESPLSQQLIEELRKRGKTYYGDEQDVPTGILSKYVVKKTSLLLPTKERQRSIVKAFLSVNGQTVVVYSAHLDPGNYAPYLPRGYSETTSKKIDAPVIETDSILVANRRSLRDEAIRGFLEDATVEVAKGHIVLVGGDFNEPSHLDWQADTKDIRDHHESVVPWDVSIMLQQSGYIDVYRHQYPNAVTHPGFTWPAGNTSAKLEKLYFAEDADERDRIDFIYYHPQPGVTLKAAYIVGPAASIHRGKIVPDETADAFIQPKGIWPSDHKGNLATFSIAPAEKTKLTFAFLTDVHLSRDLDKIPSPILFAGDEHTAYRDPTALYIDGIFHLYFTLVEIEPDGHIYSYVASSESKDLIHWSPVKKITERNQSLNYCSPGNIIRFGDEWLMCCTSYPRPDYMFGEKVMYGDATARVYIMRSKDLKTWSQPEVLRVKGDSVAVADMGRIIDPYLIQDKDDAGKYWCFYKQNGVNMSYTRDFKSWTYFGRIDGGENACVLIQNGEYLLFHSPANGIGIKKSTDLKHWRDWGDLITLGQKQWDWAKGRITAGFVLDLTNESNIGKYIMFFHGSGPLTETEGDFDKNSSVGIAWSTDLINWEWSRSF